MKHLLPVAIIWLSLFGIAAAQQPPVQTINTNQGIACNGIGPQGAVTLCLPGVTYGCSASQVSNQLIATDGQRTGWQYQNTGAVPDVMCFGATCAGNTGFVVQPGMSYMWSNIGRGNEPGRVSTTPVSVISSGGSTCTFMFTD